MYLFDPQRSHCFMDHPVLTLVKKGNLGHMLVQDQILSGHGYGFCSAESKEIYIYVAVQQHDVQMSGSGSQRPMNCGCFITDYTACSFRSTQLYLASS